MSNKSLVNVGSLIKETKEHETLWFNHVYRGRKIGYYTTLAGGEILSIKKQIDGMFVDYELRLQLEEQKCGRIEGSKLYRAIEKARTEALVG